MMPNLTRQSKVEVPRKEQEVVFFQPSYRHFRQWFSQREGLNSAVKHSILQLFTTHPVVRSANQWRWDWPCIWSGDGHLQLPLHSDPSLKSLFYHGPPTSTPPVRQEFWWLTFQTRSLSNPNTARVLQVTWSGGGQAQLLSLQGPLVRLPQNSMYHCFLQFNLQQEQMTEMERAFFF